MPQAQAQAMRATLLVDFPPPAPRVCIKPYVYTGMKVYLEISQADLRTQERPKGIELYNFLSVLTGFQSYTHHSSCTYCN